jgi:hypothetical protein
MLITSSLLVPFDLLDRDLLLSRLLEHSLTSAGLLWGYLCVVKQIHGNEAWRLSPFVLGGSSIAMHRGQQTP